MTSNYSSFSVEIKNLKYVSDDGTLFPKTAIVTFTIPDKPLPVVELYGFLDTDDVYKQIENFEDLNLCHCYVHNFSLSDYRHMKGLEEKEYISIKSIRAVDALFDSQFATDFSYAQFVNGNVDFENAHFAGGKILFNNATFGEGLKKFAYIHFHNGNVEFSNTEFGEGDVVFKNTTFGLGNKDFQYADFGKGELSFVNAEFNDGDVSFINAVFNKGATSFKVARFGKGKIDFHYAKFKGTDTSFERVEFGEGRVDFRKVEFNRGKVNFNRSIFGSGEKCFEETDFKNGKFSFKSAYLGEGNIIFEMADFTGSELNFDKSHLGHGNISFYNSKFKTLSIKSCHLSHYADFRLSKCELLDMSDTIARDIIDLKPYDFPVDIETLNFSGMRLIGRIYIDWEKNKVMTLIKNQQNVPLSLKAEQFRILKENFHNTGQYNDEDYAYVEFKRFELKDKLQSSLKKNKYSAIWAYPSYFFEKLIFDKIGLYATSPVRVLTSVLYIYSSFIILYVLLPLFTNGKLVTGTDHSDMGKIFEAFYFSGITFFTIGYGDYTPFGVLRLVAVIEGFIGVVMMSYFTVAFVRKILR
jgi:hypothetical protein